MHINYIDSLSLNTHSKIEFRKPIIFGAQVYYALLDMQLHFNQSKGEI